MGVLVLIGMIVVAAVIGIWWDGRTGSAGTRSSAGDVAPNQVMIPFGGDSSGWSGGGTGGSDSGGDAGGGGY